MLVISRTEDEVAGVAESIRAAGGSAWHAVGDASSARVDRIARSPQDVNGVELTVDGGTTANLYIVETLP